MPFRVRSGTVSKLIVIWCPEKVVKILIQRVSIVLETRDANFAQTASASAEAKQRAENAAKQLLLEEWEARLNENLSPHDFEATHGHDTQEEPGGSEWWLLLHPANGTKSGKPHASRTREAGLLVGVVATARNHTRACSAPAHLGIRFQPSHPCPPHVHVCERVSERASERASGCARARVCVHPSDERVTLLQLPTAHSSTNLKSALSVWTWYTLILRARWGYTSTLSPS